MGSEMCIRDSAGCFNNVFNRHVSSSDFVFMIQGLEVIGVSRRGLEPSFDVWVKDGL